MKVGDLVNSRKPFGDTKTGIILSLLPQSYESERLRGLNDKWLVSWFGEEPCMEWDYDLEVINENR